MKAKYTPLPWVVESNVSMKGWNHYAVTNRHAGQDWFICSITPQHLKRDVDEANGRLLAAAPVLLEALQDLLGYAVGLPNTHSAIVNARAAIAAATGESGVEG